jgi:hypothetical protein
MMATEYTPNYNLDLYASADKPNLRDQYNAAMGKIDTQMKKSANDVTNANANVLTLQTQMTEAQKNISELESTVDTHGKQITAVKKTADDALSRAQTNESGIADTQADVTSLDGRVTAAEGNIDGLQTAVGGKAPTNHASTANTYGQGSSTNFGHLKVADSGSAAASSGTAASPKMVTDQINALKSALAPTAIIAAKTVNYSNGISGSGTFSVYANSITKVVSVQLDNTSLSTAGSGNWINTTLGTIPEGYRPTRLMSQSCFSGWGILHVYTSGEVKLSVWDSQEHSAGTVNGVGLVYFAEQ